MTRKMAVRLGRLDTAKGFAWEGQTRFLIGFGEVGGPAGLADGRELYGTLTAPELATVLDAHPALSLDRGSLMALLATSDHLRGKRSRFTGARKDDLALVLERVEHQVTLTPDERTACKRLREAAGLEPAAPAAAEGGDGG